MMDDNERWQDAIHPDHDQIGPSRPTTRDGEGATDELEIGIASVFAALQAAGLEEEHGVDDEADPAANDAHTFALLGELDRLWQRPAQ